MSASFARRLGSLAVIAGAILLANRAAAQDTWTTATSGNWSTGPWSGGVPVSGTTTSLSFVAGAPTYTATDDIAGTFMLNSITFGASGTVTIASANILEFAGTSPSITIGAGNATISAPVMLGANTTVSGGSGTLTFSNGVNDNGGGFNLVMASSGSLVFAGTNGTTNSSFNQLSLQGGTSSITGGTLALTQPSLTAGGVTNNTAGLDMGTAAGQTASFTASGGATVNVSENVFVGDAAGSTGTLTITGAGTTLNNTIGGASGRFAVGNFGNGTLNILAGASVTTRFLLTNRESGSSATILVDGTGTTLNVISNASGTGTIQVASNNSLGGTGNTSTATFTISNGAAVNLTGNFALASAPGNTGTTTVTGVGSTGVGSTFAISNQLTIAAAAGATGNLTVSNGASMTIGGQLAVSESTGVGSFNIQSGGTVTASGSVFLGVSPGGLGTLNVSGAGSSFTQNGPATTTVVDIAGGATPTGTATVNLSNGATASATAQTVVGNQAGGNGTLNISSGSNYIASNTLFVGLNGASGGNPTAVGTINVSGAGSALIGSEYLAGGAQASATTVVNPGGVGALNITSGGAAAFSLNAFLGFSPGSTGTATLSGFGSSLTVSGDTVLAGNGVAAAGGGIGGTGTITANTGTKVNLVGAVFLYAGGTINVNTGAAGSVTVGGLGDGVSGATPSIGTVVVGSGSTLTINNSTTIEWDGVISGAGGVTNTGNGTQIFNGGVNTYTGPTNLNGGILNFGTINDLGLGTAINFNGGTLQYATGNTADISARTVTINNGGATIDTGSNNVTFANAIGNNLSGTGLNGALTKIGTGTLTLTPAAVGGASAGFNTYLGGTNILNGTLSVASDLALGVLNTGTAASPVFVEGGNVTGAAAATLAFTGTTTTLRSFAMNGGTIAVATGETVTFSGSQVSGATLDGTGTFATAAPGVQFIGSSSTASVTVSSASASDQFKNFSNGGALTVAAGVAALGNGIANFNNFTNQGSGSVTIAAGSSTNASNFQSYGMFNLTPNTTATPTVFTNVGTSPLFFNGGSQTFIGTSGTADPTGQNIVDYVDLHGSNAIVAGGLFVNNGGIFDTSTAGTATIIADFGALVKGAGFYQNTVKTQNGGKFQTGNSPGITTFGTLIYSGPAGNSGTSNYLWQINDGGPSSTFPAAPGRAGGTSAQMGSTDFGWSLNKAVHSGPTPGNFDWNATPTDKFTIVLQTLTPATTVGNDVQGPMGDFDPTLTYIWPLVTYVGTYTGPTTDAALNASTTFDMSSGPFSNPTLGGTFAWHLDQVDQQLDLVYTPSPVPEPGTLALTALAGLGLARSIRRRYWGAKIQGS